MKKIVGHLGHWKLSHVLLDQQKLAHLNMLAPRKKKIQEVGLSVLELQNGLW
jgi:hypothetical protein